MVKEAREHVERAYNISLDLGKFAKAVAEEELEGIKLKSLLMSLQGPCWLRDFGPLKSFLRNSIRWSARAKTISQ